MTQDRPEPVARLDTSGFPVEEVDIASLRPHPRNYRTHPPDQLAHIVQSIKEHGLYRNVVVARDSTILAGHGVVKAFGEMGRDRISVIRLPIDPDSPAALKVLAGDNEISHLAEVDDRMFAAILLDVKELDSLLGTGYDEMMLANLVYITRPEGEIADQNAAAAWAGAGMPDFQGGMMPFKLVISFRTEADRQRFVEKTELVIGKKESITWMTWWPYREQEELMALRYEAEGK